MEILKLNTRYLTAMFVMWSIMVLSVSLTETLWLSTPTTLIAAGVGFPLDSLKNTSFTYFIQSLLVRGTLSSVLGLIDNFMVIEPGWNTFLSYSISLTTKFTFVVMSDSLSL